MKLAHFYINLPGTAREAFTYYAQVFQTKILAMQTFGETPFLDKVTPAVKDKIMHIQLPLTETVHLMGSDIVEGYSPPVPIGTNFNIMVVAQDKSEADRIFEALSQNGKVSPCQLGMLLGDHISVCAMINLVFPGWSV